MKKQMLKRMAAAVLCCLTVLTSGAGVSAYAADGSSYVYDGYIYDFWGDAQECPAAFSLGGIIDSDSMASFDFGSIDDVATSADGRIFISDKTNSRVHVFDTKGEFLTSLKVLRSLDGKIALNPDGSQVTLSGPTGTYYHEKNDELYIADSGNKMVYVLDGTTYQVKHMFGRPDNMTGDTEYVPYKITVDMTDRIYVVVKSSYEGIVEMNEDGTFSRYFGVNEPQVNLVEFFWKSLATDAQKEKMGKIYAPAFTNVMADAEGLVYAVTNDSAASNSVFRLNSKGENVLREMLWPVIGDLNVMEDVSSFIDIAVTDYGVYAVLDDTEGRIFLYDYDGQILNIFGGYGKTKGQFSNPTSIAWSGYNLIVTDTDLRCAYILTPTDFGEVMLRASEEYYNGNWDAATELFRECIRWNSNYEVAYIGIGKNHLMKDEYEEAMYYFELGNARSYYSDAYNGYRGEQIRDNFWIFALLFVVGITALVISEVRYHKKTKL